MEKLKSKKTIIALVVVILAIILVVVIAKKDKNDTTTTTTTTTESTTAPKYDPTKYAIQGVNEKGVLVLLGEDGKAIINDQNQIIVVDRDEKGNIVFDANGEPQTHYEQIETKYVTKDNVFATDYTINIVEGWEGFGSGYIILEGDTSGTCLMKCITLPDVDGKKVTLDEFLAHYNANRLQQKAAKEKQGYTISYEEKKIEFTDKKIPAIYVIEETRKPDGTIQSYYENIYFELNGTNYKFQFLCSTDDAYNANKDFDFLDYANKNFIAK